MRSIPFYPLMIVLLIGLGGYLGCDPNSIAPNPEIIGDGDGGAQVPPGNFASIPQRTGTTVLIGSFNIQRLGPSKLADGFVMEKFAQIIRLFDVIALQEITSKDQRTLDALVTEVNRLGGQYSYTISPRIGRTGYLEQYAFVFDATRIAGGPEFCYVVQDDADVLHREPFVGRFRTLFPTGPFQFSLINIHTDPDEIAYELDVLATVFKNVREYEYPEDDVLLLGDLNADPNKFQQLGKIPGIMPLIDGLPTNTRKNKTLDNILIDRQMTGEFTGRAGVIDMESVFQLQLNDVERISDHLPVWAEFTATEAGGGITATAATGPTIQR
ncbi:MAG: endonuclease/exonuclease/phosphatase family protein [Pirellulaceae bacterium]